MKVKDAVGRFGEDLAARYLADSGLRVLERNWRCPDGELDIVASDGDVLAFVEVKTRSTLAFGTPAEGVTPVKAARIRRLAMRWLDEHRDPDGQREFARWTAIRFDVVAVVRLAPGGPSVQHLRGAF